MTDKLFVAMTEAGEYLKQYTISTHGGLKDKFETTGLNNADAFPRHTWKRFKTPKHILLPVVVVETRTVTILVDSEDAEC